MLHARILLVVALASFVAAELPSYITPCSIKKNEVDKCVRNNVNDLREKIKVGIPELDIPSIEPMDIKEIIFADMPNFKSSAVDIKVSGLSNFEIKKLHVDLNKQQVDVDVTFKETRIDGKYMVDATILVPVKGDGPLHLISPNVTANAKLNYKLVNRAGRKYMYFAAMTLNLNIVDYTPEYEFADMSDSPLRQAVQQALGSNHQEVIDATRPTLEKSISEFCLQTINKICKRVAFDEFFVD